MQTHSLAVVLALAVMAAPAYGAETVEARCKAITTRVSLPPLAAGDGNACDAYSLYYGSPGRAGNAADPKAAFACASKDQSRDREMGPLDGPAFLATIYANGIGAPRDLDRAEAAICRMDVAEAEKEGMLVALAQARRGEASTPFRVCDHATSSLLATACFERTNADKQNIEEDYYQDLQASLTGPARMRFATLRDAAQSFAGAIAENEVDASGTGGPVFALQAERDQKDAFLAVLRAALAGALPAAGPFAEADKALNAVYGPLMKGRDKTVLGTVDKDGIRKTQKAWIAYRDKFAAFAATAAPTLSPDALKAVLTEQRTKQLQGLGG